MNTVLRALIGSVCLGLVAVPALAEDLDLPRSMEQWIDELPSAQRDLALERLSRMSAARRERFLRRFEAAEPEARERFKQRIAQRTGARRDAYEALPDDERREVRRRWRSGPEQRERIVRELDADPPARDRLDRNRRAWRALDADGRAQMRERLERFGALSADDQAALVERHFASRPDAERAQILAKLRAASERLAAVRAQRGAPR